MTAVRTLPPPPRPQPQPTRLACWATGSVTPACLAAPTGACGPCGRPNTPNGGT